MTKEEIAEDIRNSLKKADLSDDIEHAYVTAKIFSAITWEVIDSKDAFEIVDEFVKLCEEAAIKEAKNDNRRT